MIIKQISIFVENRAGRLAEITDLIAKNNINIKALSIADTTNFGILRLIVDDPYHAEQVLKANDLTVSITSVLSVAVEDRPGGLAEVLKILSDAGIAVEYMYAFISPEINKRAYVVLRIEEDFKALEVLKNAGYNGISE